MFQPVFALFPYLGAVPLGSNQCLLWNGPSHRRHRVL